MCNLIKSLQQSIWANLCVKIDDMCLGSGSWWVGDLIKGSEER